eukprot:s76_g7.t1
MPPVFCNFCGNKWETAGGGLCQVCRTIDRLAALARGPSIPPEAEQVVLQRLRTWVGDLQDISELYRGAAPNPVQAPVGHGTGGTPPGGVKEEEPPSGTTAKAAPSPPPAPPPVPGVAGHGHSHRDRGHRVKKEEGEESDPPREEAAASSRTSPRENRRRRRSRTSSHRDRKRSRRSRSDRSRDRRRDRHLASPVRPAGVERDPSQSEEPERRRETKARPLTPRSPSRPPPAREVEREAPSRPEGGREDEKRKEERASPGKAVLGHRPPLMPPKIRRAAAAPKRVPRAPVRRVRRPSRADDEEAVAEEIIGSSKVTLDQCKGLDEIEVLKGSYWEAELRAALKVKEVYIKTGELHMRCQVLGTQSESLLRAASNRAGRMIEAHLCPLECTGGPHSEGVIHVASFRKLGQEREAWMTNMVPEERREGAGEREADELEEIRADMRRLQGPDGEKREGRGAEAPHRSASEDKKVKKRRRSRSKQKKGKDWRVDSAKEIKVLFQYTGVDPDPMVGKKFRRRAAKLARRKNRESKSGSSTTSSSSGDQVKGDSTLFGSSSKTQVIARRLPGALAASAIEEISETLVTAEGGLWETQEGPLPPLWVRAAGRKNAGPNGKRDLDIMSWSRPPHEGEGRRDSRPPHTTSESTRTPIRRSSLQRRTTTRTLTPRGHQHLHDSRTFRGRSKSPRRGQGEGRCSSPLWSQECRGIQSRGVRKRLEQERPRTAERTEGRGEEGRRRKSREREDQGELRRTPRGLKMALEDDDAEQHAETPPQLAPGEGVEARLDTVAKRPIDDLTGCGPIVPPESLKVTTAAPVSPGQLRLDGTGAGEFVQDSPCLDKDLGKDPSVAEETTWHYESPAKSGDPSLSSTGGLESQPLVFGGKHFSEVGGCLFDALQQLIWDRHSKIMTMAEDQLFPLPLGEISGIHPSRAPWMRAILLALNSMYGCAGTRTLRATEVLKKLIASLAGFLGNMWSFTEKVPTSNFGELFDVVGVDYRGEETKLARSFNWECIAGALPKEVGGVYKTVAWEEPNKNSGATGLLLIVWVQIEALKPYPPVVRLPLPREVKLELVRFMCLLPLAQMDFRLPMETQVTASDASSTGGGISCSTGLTDFGVAAQHALVRGEFPEPLELTEVLTVGLFDGIGALRVAADLLQLPMAGHISVECNPYANRVLEAAFPGSRHVASVQDVTPEEVSQWACEYSSVGVVLVGAGPPCQGVSQLNVDRKGSQKDVRSSLYKEIPRVVDLIKQKFPWAQVHVFVESVASMDAKDRAAMSRDLDMLPNKVDSAGASLARRPKLYWLAWELQAEVGLSLLEPLGSGWEQFREVELTATVDQRCFLQPGWSLPAGQRLATFTTSRPSPTPGRRPAGLHTCNAEVLRKWKEDLHRYPPYQYKPEYGVHHTSGEYRVASILEREVILGFPANYTEQCVSKSERQQDWVADVRKTLLGNPWSVPVVACLLKPLFVRLGVIPDLSVQHLVDRGVPGNNPSLQSVLQRPPIHRESARVHPEDGLARRLSGLVSIKGEDLLLQSTSEQMVKYQRLRSSIPSKLWKWKEVAGWSWKTPGEHINQLEMRAVLTSVKY